MLALSYFSWLGARLKGFTLFRRGYELHKAICNCRRQPLFTGDKMVQIFNKEIWARELPWSFGFTDMNHCSYHGLNSVFFFINHHCLICVICLEGSVWSLYLLYHCYICSWEDEKLLSIAAVFLCWIDTVILYLQAHAWPSFTGEISK